jgi:hypothetical protein
MRWIVRKAPIPDEERAVFERFGASVIGVVLAGGHGPRSDALVLIYNDPMRRAHAEAWLTEQFHREERRETWSLTMEFAITVFVLAELFLSAAAWLFPALGGRIGVQLAGFLRHR